MSAAARVADKFTQLPRIVGVLRDMRTGRGAVRLPPSITRLECSILPSNSASQEFWKEYLPRLAYNNKHVDIAVNELKEGKDVVRESIKVVEASREIKVEIQASQSADDIFHGLALSIQRSQMTDTPSGDQVKVIE